MEKRDVEHIFERLRGGLVPERGLEAFAVGIERQRAELRRQLDLVASGEGGIKFLRGGYGCGKTFLARLAVLDAQARGFATSFVVVSDNDLKFHRFDDVYHKVLTELSTDLCPRGALGDILDRWIANVEEALIAGGADEEDPSFDAQVRERLEAELASRTRGAAPDDFVRCIRGVFDAKQEGELEEAGALLSWLSGSGNVAASARQRAGIKGEIDSRDALAYLRGVVEITKAAGYAGLVIVIDEAETLLRSRGDVRAKSMNGLRQICDAASGFPGLLWLITGTPEFFDSRRGVGGLPPLDDRIRFAEHGGFASLRQPQLRLSPFDAERLREVALRLRALYPAGDRRLLEERLSPGFLEALVGQVTAGLGGDVGVVPRQFLRALVGHMDLVDEEPGYDPALALDARRGPPPAPLRPEEQTACAPTAAPLAEPDEDLIPVEDVW